MYVDSSAIVAILAEEEEAKTFASLIEASDHVCTGSHVRIEASVNLARILGLRIEDADALYDRFLMAANIAVLPITDAVSRRAIAAYARYGRGQGHPARLNFGDCLSYACAAEAAQAILFKGDDFGRTDLSPAYDGLTSSA